MAPVTKAETYLELSSIKTYNTSSSSGSTDQATHQQMMDAIFQLLMTIGLDEGILAKNFDQSQADQSQIAQAQAQSANTQTQNYLAQLAKAEKEQASAHRWSIFGEVMKWVGVAVGVVVGGLLCESPVGFAILAGVIAFAASPLFNKAVSALGTAIGDAIGNQTWGNILAQVITVVVLTVASAGAEGLAAGFSSAGSVAGETAAEAGSQAVTKAASAAAEDATEEVVEAETTEVTTQASQDASSEPSSNDASKPSTPKSKIGTATKMVFATAVTSTNLPGSLIATIPGNSGFEKVAKEVLTVIADLAVMVATLYSCSSSGGSTLMEQLTNSLPKLKSLLMAAPGVVSVAKGGATSVQGIYGYEAGVNNNELGPIEAAIQRFDSYSKVLDSMTQVTAELNKTLVKTFENLSTVNFSADWQAAAQAINQYLG